MSERTYRRNKSNAFYKFVVTYDHSKVNAEFLNITDKTYGSAKGCVIHENNYIYFEKQGYLSNNSGVLYSFKNTKRDNTMYAESKEINAAILDVKIQNAKKGKKYKLISLEMVQRHGGNQTTRYIYKKWTNISKTSFKFSVEVTIIFLRLQNLLLRGLFQTQKLILLCLLLLITLK